MNTRALLPSQSCFGSVRSFLAHPHGYAGRSAHWQRPGYFLSWGAVGAEVEMSGPLQRDTQRLILHADQIKRPLGLTLPHNDGEPEALCQGQRVHGDEEADAARVHELKLT
jgi:hypothetical protein